MRYVWDPSFLAGERLGPVGRTAFRVLTPHLRRTDLRGAAQVGAFAANSTFVAARIAKYYRRDATVVHPPVDVGRFAQVRRSPQDPYLFFGRLVPYKRADLAVAACERLGRPLWVAGEGRDIDRARALAGPHTEFLGRVSDDDVLELFGRARALLFPGEEDFGIVPVEAQAAGLPVIAYGSGGVRDTVTDGETGVLYDEQGVDGLCAAIERFESLSFGADALRANAARFSPERFDEALGHVLLQAGGVA
jgi:glycosyltransferase involved in cell wall biosynthesis